MAIGRELVSEQKNPEGGHTNPTASQFCPITGIDPGIDLGIDPGPNIDSENR